jgi:hypothetical protein
LKEKLSDCNIQPEMSQKIVDDIFDKKLGEVFVEGLVDAPDDRGFQDKLEAVI